jgi:hypothetical protein
MSWKLSRSSLQDIPQLRGWLGGFSPHSTPPPDLFNIYLNIIIPSITSLSVWWLSWVVSAEVMCIFQSNTLRFIKPYFFRVSNHLSFSGPKHFPPLTILTCSFRSLLYLNIKRVCKFSLERLGEMTRIQLLMGIWLISAVKCTGRREGRTKRKCGECWGDRDEELSK